MNSIDEQVMQTSLASLIGRNADWLDGPTFMRLCEQTARAYFDDLPSADDLVQALRKELGL